MSNILLTGVFISVMVVHLYIIKYEIKSKRIPNEILIILLFFNLSYFFINPIEFHFITFFIKIFVLFSIGISLYYLKTWGPSYIKYIFVSSLFFLGNGEITFIGNIFFIILLYIIVFFFYYYLDILLHYKKLKAYIKSFKLEFKGNLNNWLIANKEFVYLKIFLIILGFFSVFILTRFLRMYLQGELSQFFFVKTIDNITINTIIFIFIGIFLINLLIKRFYKKYIHNNYKYIVLTICFTIGFIIYEYIYDYYFISNYLHKILTFILILYIFIRVVAKMGKYLFFENDSKIINYKELKVGDIIDKKMIKTYLIGQKSLKDDNVELFIENIKNPINQKDCEKIKELIQKNSDYHNMMGNHLPPNTIRIYKNFLFTPFVFGSFILTYIVKKNLLIIFLIEIYSRIIGLGK